MKEVAELCSEVNEVDVPCRFEMRIEMKMYHCLSTCTTRSM